MDQTFADFDNIQISVLDLPELARPELMSALHCFSLHMGKDTGGVNLLRERGLQLCNVFVGLPI